MSNLNIIVYGGQMIEINKLYHGDCFDIMPKIPDKSVDMILCDMPYGMTACNWDTIINLDQLWIEYKRITKPNSAIVLTASQPFASRLVMSNPKMFRYEWIWDKVRGSGFLSAKYRPIKQHENILVFSKKKANYYPIMTKRDKVIKGKNYKHNIYRKLIKYEDKVFEYHYKYPNTILTIGKDEKKNTRIHPTQKPVALFEYLIRTYTKEGELVLDNCAGSCTTAIAAINTNRNWICIESNEEYYISAKERIEKHQKNFENNT